MVRKSVGVVCLFLLLVSFFASTLVLPTQVLAQKSRTRGKNRKIKKKVVDFQDELIKGEFNKPELMHLLRKEPFNYKRLLKLRENFLVEMESDAAVVK